MERPALALLLLGLAAGGAAVLFMAYDLQGSLAFALELRGRQAAGIGIVGFAVGYAAVLFHTITQNRILTPNLMGFDALYILIQTGAAFMFGALAFLSLDVRLRFGLEMAAMLGFAGLLYRLLFGRESRDLFRLVLAGIIIGTIFSSLTALLTRLIDPNEFMTLQDLLFANFSSVNQDLLLVSGGLLLLTAAATRPLLRQLDAAALGREYAINLGVEHRRLVRQCLLAVAVLVSLSTALVGPVAFLGAAGVASGLPANRNFPASLHRSGGRAGGGGGAAGRPIPAERSFRLGRPAQRDNQLYRRRLFHSAAAAGGAALTPLFRRRDVNAATRRFWRREAKL